MGATSFISNTRTQHWSKQPVANRNQPVYPQNVVAKPAYLTNTPEPKLLDSSQRQIGGAPNQTLYKTNWQPQKQQPQMMITMNINFG